MLSGELIVCKECGQVSVSRERHTAHLSEPRHIHHYRSGDTKRFILNSSILQSQVLNKCEEAGISGRFIVYDVGLMFSGLWLTKTQKEEMFG